ncbi:SRPBCC domain-containing protein [Paenibacillus sp. GCM10012307]|uniref:SRPBCC domain-containing protein n=1 Tax=Paenibacillus roseus TaxID=2798579 RepID=A0A934MX22_9BACL|nr:SRPBCC domain-containing protein [Paenibacillus roseus]MBJ6363732.1 SRPBCC domain-containing protein [Paenibacillus roseus]
MSEHMESRLPDIRKTVVFNASIEKTWEAVATSEGLEAWFMPNDFEPVEGHEFHLNAAQFGMSPCTVIEVDRPNRLAFRWGKDWTITMELKDLGGKTEFTLIHSGWAADTVTEFGDSHTVIRGRMEGGWEPMVDKRLRALVEGQ